MWSIKLFFVEYKVIFDKTLIYVCYVDKVVKEIFNEVYTISVVT